MLFPILFFTGNGGSPEMHTHAAFPYSQRKSHPHPSSRSSNEGHQKANPKAFRTFLWRSLTNGCYQDTLFHTLKRNPWDANTALTTLVLAHRCSRRRTNSPHISVSVHSSSANSICQKRLSICEPTNISSMRARSVPLINGLVEARLDKTYLPCFLHWKCPTN